MGTALPRISEGFLGEMGCGILRVRVGAPFNCNKERNMSEISKPETDEVVDPQELRPEECAEVSGGNRSSAYQFWGGGTATIFTSKRSRRKW